jgi:hypothetical protein
MSAQSPIVLDDSDSEVGSVHSDDEGGGRTEGWRDSDGAADDSDEDALNAALAEVPDSAFLVAPTSAHTHNLPDGVGEGVAARAAGSRGGGAGAGGPLKDALLTNVSAKLGLSAGFR